MHALGVQECRPQYARVPSGPLLAEQYLSNPLVSNNALEMQSDDCITVHPFVVIVFVVFIIVIVAVDR